MNRKNNPFAYLAGWGGLSLILTVNFFTLLEINEIFTGIGFTQLGANSNAPIILITLVFLIFNHFIFLRGGRYKWIIKKFENEDRVSRIKGNIFAWGCIIVTILFCILTAFALRHFRPPQSNVTSAIIVQGQQQAIMDEEKQMLQSAQNFPSQNNSYNDRLHLPGITKN